MVWWPIGRGRLTNTRTPGTPALRFDLGQLQYLPLALPHFSLLAGIFLVLVVWIEVRAFSLAYLRMGFGPHAAVVLLFASLAGSYLNLPVARLPAHQIVSGEEIPFFGMSYVIPVVVNWPGTVIAVNIGGAVIPSLLLLYLLVRNQLWVRGLVATAIVTAVCHTLARPVPGLGIALPVFVPPFSAAVTALLLSRGQAGPLAYISGSLGTLIGADLLNLDKVRGLGAPVASIGGAGTFDGIFLTGVLAVLIASIFGPSEFPQGQPGIHSKKAGS
jgi:uncharacterized membrane protein